VVSHFCILIQKDLRDYIRKKRKNERVPPNHKFVLADLRDYAVYMKVVDPVVVPTVALTVYIPESFHRDPPEVNGIMNTP